MQIMITVPDNLPRQRIQQSIRELEARLQEEARLATYQSHPAATENLDPWADPDGEVPSVDTGIRDLAENHDYYLYGTPKRA